MNDQRVTALPTILAFSGGACAFFWLMKKLRNKEDKGAIVKCVGNFEDVSKRRKENIPELLFHLTKENGCLYKIKIESENLVVVNSPKIIKLVGVAKGAGLLNDKVDLVQFLMDCTNRDPCKRENNPEKIREQSKKMIGAYNKENQILGTNVVVEMEKLEHVLRSYERSEVALKPHTLFSYSSINVISSLVFGCRFKYKSKRLKMLNQMVDAHLSCLNFFHKSLKENVDNCINYSQPIQTIFKNNLQNLVCFIESEVETHKKTFDITNYRDFIDVFLKSQCHENGELAPISKLTMEVTVIEFFTRGAKQISNHLLWTIFCMVEFPDVQNKCHDEIDSKIGQCRPVTLDDYNALSYVIATLREVSRRFTIQPLSTALVSASDFKLGPYKINKDEIIICNYHSVHMDSKLWKDPITFWPERFLPCKCCWEGKLFNYGASDSEFECPAASFSFKTVFLIFANLLQKFDFEKTSSDECLTTSGYYDFLFNPPNFSIKIDSH